MTWLQTQLNRLRRNPVITLVIGALLGWALENFFTWLFAQRGVPGILVLLAALLAAILLFQSARWLWQRLLPSPKILVGVPPRPHRGLILLFSNEVTFAKAVAHHYEHLAHLWLIVTPEAAEKARAAASALTGVTVYEQPVRTAWNPDDTALAVRRAFEHATDLGLRHDDLICDVTGGTKPMTIGATVACMAQDLKVQMVAAKYDEDLKHPKTLEVIEVRLL